VTLEPRVAAMLAARLPVETPSLLDHRSAWTGHLPFAMWLVAAHRPRRIVELGVHVGVSFCTFAEEVQRQGLPTTALGVDTFAGDAHAGRYDGSVLERLRAHHDPRYGAASRLFQGSFDAAAAMEPDGGIDLLHIDGLHTYDAVRHDYQTWAPKLSPRGIVLFHDTAETHGDFGVWTLWAELPARHSHFTFTHAHGLGVLAPGPVEDPLRPLFDATPAEAAQIAALFEGFGARLLAATPRPPKPPKRRWPRPW
jgi:hypothetical protein